MKKVFFFDRITITSSCQKKVQGDVHRTQRMTFYTMLVSKTYITNYRVHAVNGAFNLVRCDHLMLSISDRSLAQKICPFLLGQEMFAKQARLEAQPQSSHLCLQKKINELLTAELLEEEEKHSPLVGTCKRGKRLMTCQGKEHEKTRASHTILR